MIELLVWRLHAHRAKDLQLKRGFLAYTREALPQPPKTGTTLFEMKGILGWNSIKRLACRLSGLLV